MATDFHEERKWKMAAAHVNARAAAGEAVRRASTASVEDSQQARRASQRLAQGVVGFWRSVSHDMRFYSDSDTALRSTTTDAASSSAAPSTANTVEVADVAETTRQVNECVSRSQEVLTKELAWIDTHPDARKGPLLPHQLLAVRWLVELGKLKCGAILADQAGMGKTVTAVALLDSLNTELAAKAAAQADPSAAAPAPHLVVAPYWSLVRWRTEIRRHATSLGGVALLEDWISSSRSSSSSSSSSARPARRKVDVVLCSTATLGSPAERQRLTDMEWSSIVLDAREEGARVWAASPSGALSEWSKMAPICPSLRASHRVLLIDDHMAARAEYHAAWAVVLLPQLFPTPEHAMAWASKAVAAGSGPSSPQDQITKLIGSFQLSRQVKNCRLVADVIHASVVPCPMTDAHALEYRRVLALTRAAGVEEDARKLVALRYACFHADLPFWFENGLVPPPPPPPNAPPVANGQAASSSSSNKGCKALSRLLTPAPTSSDPSVTSWRSSVEDTSPFGPHHSIPGCVTKSGKLTQLRTLLTQLLATDTKRKVLLLAGLPHALSLIHTFLCAAEIAHEYALPQTMGLGGDGGPIMAKDGPEPWVLAQAAIARFNLTPGVRVLVAPTWGCWGRGGLVPSQADVVVVMDDDWSQEGRRGLRELLSRMRMRLKALSVYRLVSASTVESMMWDEKRPAGESKLDTVLGGSVAVALASMSRLTPGPPDVNVMEPPLWAQERRLLESVLPLGLFRPGGSMGVDLCRDCYHRRAIGGYGKRLLREAAGHGAADGGKWSLGTLQRGSPVDALLGMDERGGETGLVHEARALLVREFPANTTKAQAWLDITTAMKVAGIDIDPIVAAPPVPPIEGLTEVISHPSWMMDPADADLGLVIKYIQVGAAPN